PLAVHDQGPGVVQLPRLAARTAPAPQRLPVRAELLHPAILVFDDVKIALRAKRQIIRVAKLARFRARLAERPHKLAVAGEDLDAIVDRVGHIKIPVGAQSQGPKALELARLGSGFAPGLHDFAVAVELSDPIILSEFRDVEVAVAILNHVADVAKLTRLG